MRRFSCGEMDGKQARILRGIRERREIRKKKRCTRMLFISSGDSEFKTLSWPVFTLANGFRRYPQCHFESGAVGFMQRSFDFSAGNHVTALRSYESENRHGRQHCAAFHNISETNHQLQPLDVYHERFNRPLLLFYHKSNQHVSLIVFHLVRGSQVHSLPRLTM